MNCFAYLECSKTKKVLVDATLKSRTRTIQAEEQEMHTNVLELKMNGFIAPEVLVDVAPLEEQSYQPDREMRPIKTKMKPLCTSMKCSSFQQFFLFRMKQKLA
ncbi:uncharacterized protein LOC144003798 isoform X3 [Festucalex cinctus]